MIKEMCWKEHEHMVKRNVQYNAYYLVTFSTTSTNDGNSYLQAFKLCFTYIGWALEYDFIESYKNRMCVYIYSHLCDLMPCQDIKSRLQLYACEFYLFYNNFRFYVNNFLTLKVVHLKSSHLQETSSDLLRAKGQTHVHTHVKRSRVTSFVFYILSLLGKARDYSTLVYYTKSLILD